MTDTTPSNARNDDEIDVLQLVGVIWRGRWVVLLCAVLAVLIGAFYAYRLATPMYPASATIALQGEQQQVITDFESILAGGGTDVTAINTQFEVIRSRSLIGDLVDELDLVSDPEFNGLLRTPSLRARVINSVLGRTQDTEPSPQSARRGVIDAIVSSVSVSAIRQSLAFRISIQTTSPDKSTLIVNTLAELYIESQIQQKLEATEQAISFLSRRTTELENNVEMLEQDLAERTEQSSLTSADVLQARNLQLRDLRDRISDLATRTATEQALIEGLENTPSNDVLVSRLEQSNDVRLSSLAQRFLSGRLTQEGLEASVREVLAEIRRSIARSDQQLETLRSSETDLSTQIRVQSEELISLQQLEREVEAARLLYETFFNRLQEASVQQGLETADARILSEAVPRHAASPRRSLILMLSAIFGSIIGAGIALLREWRFSGFRTSDDLRRETGQRILGTVPSLGNDDRRAALAHMKANPNSVFAEAVRNLRTSILMSNIDSEPKVILVTSAIPGEGKTTVSIALTRYLASMEGKRSLLLEADIRRKTLRAYVDEEPKVALMDILLGRLRAEEIELFNEELGVEVLAGSESGGNAADLFASRRFKDLMEALKHEFDYIVIDSPPVLAVPDARVLANYADAITYVVRWSSTTKTQVQQGVDMLESVGAEITGLVLTQVDQKKMKSYGYKGQYGYDGYSSGYYGQS